MQESPEVRAAIEDLYAMFGNYELRADTNACLCCHSAYDEERVHHKPLRKLSADDLRRYATDALFVWGDETDFKHFLPRIFELEVLLGDDFVDPQAAFGKLTYAEWRHWPEGEQRAVEQFLRAVWPSVINSEPFLYGLRIDDWLCGIARAESDLSWYVETWLSSDSEYAALNLAAFISDTDFAEATSRPDGYWSECPDSFEQVKLWVRTSEVKAKMAELMAAYPQYDFVERAYVSLP